MILIAIVSEAAEMAVTHLDLVVLIEEALEEGEIETIMIVAEDSEEEVENVQLDPLGDFQDEVIDPLLRCAVCLLRREETWCFLDCGHANVCGPCSEQSEATGRGCPTCRARIVRRIRVYN